jgi:hypothetical protein
MSFNALRKRLQARSWYSAKLRVPHRLSKTTIFLTSFFFKTVCSETVKSLFIYMSAINPTYWTTYVTCLPLTHSTTKILIHSTLHKKKHLLNSDSKRERMWHRVCYTVYRMTVPGDSFITVKANPLMNHVAACMIYFIFPTSFCPPPAPPPPSRAYTQGRSNLLLKQTTVHSARFRSYSAIKDTDDNIRRSDI